MWARNCVCLLSALASTVQADAPWIRDYAEYNVDLAYGVTPNQTYKSVKLQSPLLRVGTFNKTQLDPDLPYIFAGIEGPDGRYAPMIFRADDLSLVYKDDYTQAVGNVRVQQYMGRQFMTYWVGTFAGGHGNGHLLFFDQHYQMTKNLTALQTHSQADMHESQMTDDGTLLISVYQDKQMDLTSVGGPKNGTVADGCFQEIDLYTNELLFSWCASDHFAVNETYTPYSSETEGSAAGGGGTGISVGWDFFHLNSVQKRNGNYLVNGRLLKMVAYVSGATGKPIFQLGGKKNQFKDLSDGKATNFAYEHHVRLRSDDMTQITMFDNHELLLNQNCTTNCSRGLHLALDHDAMTVKVVQEYFNPSHLTSGAMGSYVPLPSGNVLVGWGISPSFSEHTPDGKCVMDVQTSSYAAQQFNYRVFRQNWTGLPKWAPAAAAEGGALYVSWNGATEYTDWRITTAPSQSNMTADSKQMLVPRGGFETSIMVGTTGYAMAEALSADGQVLGKTAVVNLGTGAISGNGTSTY